MLTNLSAVQFVGQSAQAYENNLSVIGWEVGSGIVLVVVALVLLPRYLKQGITTIPQFVESRFDVQTKNYITILFLAGYVINMLPVTLYAGAVAISQIFNISGLFHITYGQGKWAKRSYVSGIYESFHTYHSDYSGHYGIPIIGA